MSELCRARGKPAEWILALVDEGVIDPVGAEQAHGHFNGHCLHRVRIVHRPQSDLSLNLACAALTLELLEEVEALRNLITVMEGHTQ